MRYRGKKKRKGIKVALLLGVILALAILFPFKKVHWPEQTYEGYVTKIYCRNAASIFDKSLVYVSAEEEDMVFSLEYFIRHHIHIDIRLGHHYMFVVRGNGETPEIIRYEEK